MWIGILGAGNWGTTFALLSHRAGHSVSLWEFDKAQAERLTAARENARFLPGYRIPSDIVITSSLPEAVQGDVVVLAVPAQTCRLVLRQIGSVPKETVVLSLMKGIEQETLATVSTICEQELSGFDADQFALLSGPTIAPEVASGLPTSAVIASTSATVGVEIQNALSSPQFRLYTSDDVIGVELGGALKNVIAIAAGMSDGMNLGYNTKGALVTRGLAELIRLGEALGGKRHTLTGLSGMGDLVTTCTSPMSRNRTLGERIGRGEAIEVVLSSIVMVTEGVWTARAARELAKSHRISVPITDAVCDVLFEKKSPRDALNELMLRALKAED